MEGPKRQNYLHGAAILAAGVVIMKILGAIYKIPLGNILGDEGYAYFLVAYNIYNVFLTLATAGLPVALSRLLAESNALGKSVQARRTFNIAFMTFLVLGVFCTLVMYMFPTELAIMMNKPEAAQSIWVLSPAVVLVCVMSAYRGFAQGHENMTPTTVSQVLEVLVKVIVGLALAWYLVRAGKSLAISSAGAIFGVTAGALAALIYIVIYKNKYYKNTAISAPDVPEGRGRIFAKLIKIGIPITIGSSVLSLINLIDTKLVLNRLQLAAGFSDYESSILYGVYGKAQTLYNLPAAFITPLTISIVPAIAAYMVRGRRREAAHLAEASMRISTVVALPMGVGLAVLCRPLMEALYPGSNESGPMLLMLLSIASYFVCMALIMNAVLQANGNENLPVYSMLAGGIVKIVVNWVLVANPAINITGAPVGTICCYAVMCAMDYIFLCRCLAARPNLYRTFLRPAISSAAMGAAAWGVYGLISKLLSSGGALSWAGTAISMAAAIVVAVVVYFVMIMATRAVTAEDMKLIPKGEKIASLLKIR